MDNRYRKPLRFKKTRDWDWLILIVGAIGIFVFLYLAGIGTCYLLIKISPVI